MDADPKRNKAHRGKAGRRDFLKLVGLGGVATGAALATGGKPAPAPAQETSDNAGYRDSPHVRKYYESAKF